MGLGRAVVRTCRKADFGDAHFDTNHYPHMLWLNNEDLRSQLADRIKALNLAKRF